mgnify:CR=1 FL=1
MKIRPVILCGGSGTRLWSDQKHHQPKQFIDFGNWTLFGKTLERIKNSIFDYPVISTNKKYDANPTELKIIHITIILYLAAVNGDFPDKICPVIIPGSETRPTANSEFVIGINDALSAMPFASS